MVKVDGSGTSSLIRVRDLDKTYQRGGEDIDVLQGLNLDVKQGEFIAFMGPSGSGKTTLLNLLGGLDVPSTGSVTVAGDEITHMSASKLTAWRRRHVETALEVVGLGDRMRHYPRQLSGGQEQRVGIARAIVADPTFLLCDEPTGDLDRKSADEILGLLDRLVRDHRKTVLMVTHDPLAADRARLVLHLEKGVLVESMTAGGAR